MNVTTDRQPSVFIDLTEVEAHKLSSLLEWAGRSTHGGAITKSEMKLAALLASLLMGDGDEEDRGHGGHAGVRL